MGIYNTPKFIFFFDESKRTILPSEIYIGSINENDGSSFFNESKRTTLPSEIYIGSIWISDDILNESLGRIKTGKGIENTFDVKVFGNEGPFPHFHLKSNDGKRNCAILLFDNMYFTHKHANYVFRNDKVIFKIIDEFLKSHNKESGTNQWYTLIQSFLSLNGKPTNLTMQECYSIQYPDYLSGIKQTDENVYNSDLEKVLDRKIQGV